MSESRALQEQLSRYPLEAPSRDSAIAMLTRVVGQAEATRSWRAATEAAGVEGDLTLDDLHAVAEVLRKEDGPVAVSGMSLQVRITTYRTLSRHEAGRTA